MRRVFVFMPLVIAMLFVACSDDNPSSVNSKENVRAEYVLDDWNDFRFVVEPRHIFGDTTATEWPDHVLEIGKARDDSLMVVAAPNIPLIDTIMGSWYRNYIANGMLARCFRLTAEDVDGMERDSVVIRITTRNQLGVVYGDVAPVDMVFYKAGKSSDKIYYQNQILSGDSLGKPVLFSQTGENAGDYDEAYVLVIKNKDTDTFYFEYLEMPKKPKPCKKDYVCYETMVSFSNCDKEQASLPLRRVKKGDSLVVDTLSSEENQEEKDSVLVGDSAWVTRSLDLDSLDTALFLRYDTLEHSPFIRICETGWRYQPVCESLCVADPD